MMKYLSQKKSMINQKRKDWRQNDLLILGFEHVYFKSWYETLMFRNYLGLVG